MCLRCLNAAGGGPCRMENMADQDEEKTETVPQQSEDGHKSTKDGRHTIPAQMI